MNRAKIWMLYSDIYQKSIRRGHQHIAITATAASKGYKFQHFS